MQGVINFDENLFTIPVGIYEDTKNQVRIDYEKRVRELKKDDNFKTSFADMMKKANNEIDFEMDIAQDDNKRYAFSETLRQLYKKRTPSKVVVRAETLDKQQKWFTLSNKHNLEATIGHITGELDLTEDQSDTNPVITNGFIPVRFEVLFINQDNTGNGVRFRTRRQDPDTHEIYTEDVEVDENYRGAPEGSFFPYVNLSPVDLSVFQIFHDVNPNNYHDNCFVYACIQSGVFTEDEINHLRFFVQTKSIPNNKIIEVAKQFKCNFVVKRINEFKTSKNHQVIHIDTRKKEWAKDFKRTVEMFLYKEHYMIYKKYPCTMFYLDHYQELDKEFARIPQERRQLITRLHKNGKTVKEYSKTGLFPFILLQKLFQLNLFREIQSCEMNILTTTEYDNLNDYQILDYPVELCTKLITTHDWDKKEKKWSRIYYSDFETDPTVSPHEPYLNCTVYREEANIHKVSFIGENSGEKLLNYLWNGSLTYFHNLKYDACFFINTPGWKTEITERTGTVLQIIMLKYEKEKDKEKLIKKLTFRNSYSIIPSALRNFANMFNLEVHKEVMAYKLYTKENRERQLVDEKEFIDQYIEENIDNLTTEELEQNTKQLIENAKNANCYNEGKIDIIKYALFYCFKDCIVLMKGMEKFNNDLKQVFSETKTEMLNVHNFISISSIGYKFAKEYGCFDGCYELSGKPQNFIQRCVSGGRTMTAENKKQYVEGRIQDFDAVSLYPSAMNVMDGVPKGIPKVIPSNITTEQLLKYDTFFVEINIKKLKCKSEHPYKFGLVFRRNDAGSKIFDNNPIDNFYIDKVGLLDLIEYYEIEFEVIRGYYFDEGFNKKINQFIEGLFNLRLKYKKEKNPLQSTIKLLLNSVYGKSILKAIKTETKTVPKDKLMKYIWRNYNFIKEIVDNPNIDKCYVKKLKPINDHFNLPQFGASVLSWSKHLMNRVMCTAEQNGINIYYVDTDSCHVMENDVPKIADLFKFRFHKELIGEKMGQFHNDFDSFPGAVGAIHSRKLIALGKKSYLDILVDEQGHEGYHIRLKGIPHQVILNKCKRLRIGIEELYERLYRGEEIIFDLLDGNNGFRKSKSFEQTNLPTFYRKVRFI